MASYRIGHRHNCYKDHDLIMKMYGSKDNINKIDSKRTRQKWGLSDHLGLTLLDSSLNIVHETIVSLKNCNKRNNTICDYQDYRLFTIEDQIYLSTFGVFAPISLVPKDGYTLLDYAFDVPEGQQQNEEQEQGFPVWIRNYESSAIYLNPKNPYSDKNILYFVDSTGQPLADFIPSHNPHPLYKVQPDLPYNLSNIIQVTGGSDNKNHPRQLPIPPTSFATIDELLFPTMEKRQNLFIRSDRGSGCCATIQHILLLQQQTKHTF